MARIIAVLMLIALPAAFAFPQFWVGENKAAGTCSKHPTGPEGNHGAPVPDKTSKYIVKGADGKAATTVCPGATYAVTINYGGQSRLSLTTASVGALSTDAPCTGRFYTQKAARGPSASFNWVVPCTATGSVSLKTTSAAGEMAAFQNAALTMPVNAACAAAACKAAKKTAAPATRGL